MDEFLYFNELILLLFEQGPDWSYETKLPPWAQAEWTHEEF